MRWISITIFLFLIILIPSAVAEVEYFEKSASQQYHINYNQEAALGAQYQTNVVIFNDIDTMKSIQSITLKVHINSWEGGTAKSAWNSVEYHIGSVSGTVIGTGSYGYNQGETYVWIIATFDADNDFGDYSGAQNVFITGGPDIHIGDSASSTVGSWYNAAELDVSTPTTVYLGAFSGSNYYASAHEQAYGNTDGNIYSKYSFINSYEYYTNGIINTMNIVRTGNQSTWTVERGGDIIYFDTSDSTADQPINDNDIANNTWDIMCNDSYGNTYTDTIYFIADITSYGTIELNQSSYTEPDLIQIDIELTTYDFTDHSYYIITEVSEDLDYWDNVAGTYNGTTKITTTTASRILDVDTWLYDLPIWIRSRLVDYNKLTGEYTTLDTTPAVLFNPPTPGSIKFGGTVIDADTNEIISGATVSVDGVTTASDTTNAFGEFLIYLYPGIYTVTTSKTGYQTSTSEDLLMEFDNTWAQIYLTPIGYGNGTLYGNVNDADTGYAIKDVHVIITNATDQIDAYTSSGGYYEATGLAQSSTYTIQAVKSGYYTYNGSVTTEASGASHKSFNMVSETVTPTPTATVLPTSTYPGGEGHEWTNDEIVTMLRVIVPGFFLLMLVFLLLAVMLGLSGNNGNNGQGRSGLGELWRR